MERKTTKRKSHSGKSKQARQAYAKTLKNLEYEPTTVESFNFSDSNDFHKDFSVPQSNKRRERNWGEIISEHFKEKWVLWLMSLFGIAIVYFITDFSREMGFMQSTLESIKEDLAGHDTDLDKLTEKIHKQELNAQRNDLKIEQFGKELKAINSKSTEK